jgi:hypothetical protein
VFDAAEFAGRYGLRADLFGKCADERAAVALLAGIHRNLEQMQGRQADELGQARRRVQELEAARQVPAAAPAAAAAGTAAGVAAAVKEMTRAEREAFFAEFDENPIAAARKWGMAGGTGEEAIKPLVERIAKLEGEIERQRESTRQARVERAGDAEEKELKGKYADWESRRADVSAMGERLGWKAPMLDIYELAVQNDSDAAGVGEIMGLLERGVPIDVARENVRLKRVAAGGDASARTSTLVDKARVVGSGGTGRGPAAPAVQTTASDTRDLDLDDFRV